ncbi:MAG: 50S ribosomal protein L2 [Nanoarchaeota archaeon]
MGKNLIQQARGKGGPTYRAPSFKFKGVARVEHKGCARVVDLIRCRAHSAPLAFVEYPDKTTGYIIAAEGLFVGDQLTIGAEAEHKTGNTLPLYNIPEGTDIFNIENRPGDGGKFVRSSGLSAKIITKTQDKITILLPSKKKKDFNPRCAATIGVVAGGGRTEKPFLKAGKMFFKAKQKNHYWPMISGSAQNAVDHPFGNKRTSRKSKAHPVGRGTPPGRKVGMLYARRTGRKRGKQ